MSKRIDLTGQQINEWTVLEYLGDRKYLCRCSCGVEKPVSAYSLTSGASKSCGHAELVHKPIEVGDTYGSLKVVRYAGNYSWECQCKCGRTVIALGKYLKNGKITSCGNHKAEDLTGKTFGYWKVIKYAGNLRWTCQCKCGTVRDVLTQALKSGRSKSCGCGGIDVAANYREKMLAKYGDISINRAGNPRELWQIETLNDSEKLKDLILKVSSKTNKKATITELATLLDSSFITVARALKRFKLNGLVDLEAKASLKETILYEWISSIYYGEVLRNDRDIIYPYELDIVIPDKKIAIEFNGTYWHSELASPNMYYHLMKTNMCNKAGYRLIHIFEYEWDLNNAAIKQFIASELIEGTSIPLNSVLVQDISNEAASNFLNDNHIFRSCDSDINIGIIHHNHIVGLAAIKTIGNSQDRKYEILRIAYKNGVNIPEGTKYMIKYFVHKFRPQCVTMKCNLAKFSGDECISLGMVLKEQSDPNCIWINCSGQILKVDNPDKSDIEKMHNLGYFRIYDCGNKVFTWEHKQGGID